MNKPIAAGIAGLVIGIALSSFVASWAVNGNHESTLKIFGIDTSKVMSSKELSQGSDASMNDMMVSLNGKTGDDFDKAFISEMIVHHQGAVDMANAAKTNAKHDEIKRMANNIINAQTKEIDQMKTWQTEWDYRDNGSSVTDHSMH
jgi:uncharacterized protein (DUF305 family)